MNISDAFVLALCLNVFTVGIPSAEVARGLISLTHTTINGAGEAETKSSSPMNGSFNHIEMRASELYLGFEF